MNEHRYNKGDVVYTRPGLNNSLGDDYAGSGYEPYLKVTIFSGNINRDGRNYYIVSDETGKKRVIFEVCLMDIAERRDYLIENLIE